MPSCDSRLNGLQTTRRIARALTSLVAREPLGAKNNGGSAFATPAME